MRAALAATVASGWPDATIAEASDFTAALRLAADAPDLCIVDLAMPGAAPVAGIMQLRAAAPATHILVVSGIDDDAVMMELLDCGVSGFVPKSAPPGVVAAALALVLAGGRYLPERVAAIAANRPQRTLSARQIEVLRLMAAGQSNKAIARLLGLTPATVKSHVAATLAGLAAANRTEAAARGRELGLV